MGARPLPAPAMNERASESMLQRRALRASLRARHQHSARRSRPSAARECDERRAEAGAGRGPVPRVAAVFGRRARRFALGASPPGPLSTRTSGHDPVPLNRSPRRPARSSPRPPGSPVSSATNAVPRRDRHDHWRRQARDFPGRTYPSPPADHSTEASASTNDDGVFVLPQRDVARRSYVANQTVEEHLLLRKGAVRLAERAAGHPAGRPNLFAFNHQLVNVAGLDPVHPDRGRHPAVHLSTAALPGQTTRLTHLWDARFSSDARPLQAFVDDGFLSDGQPGRHQRFRTLADGRRDGCVEAGLVVGNLSVATQALGLRRPPFSVAQGPGRHGRLDPAGTRPGCGEAGSLGFRFHRVPTTLRSVPGEHLPIGLRRRVRSPRSRPITNDPGRGRRRRRAALGRARHVRR